MKEPVSVIIPTYNRKVLLQQNLNAIGNQNFDGHLEVIIIDDGSSDGTEQMLKDRLVKDNKFIFNYFRTEHIGPARARNIGLSKSSGKILIFLDDDSVIQGRDYVREIIKSFENPSVGIVGGKTMDILSGIYKLIRAGDPPEIDFDKNPSLTDIVGVPLKNAAFSRIAIEEVGGFNPIFKYALCEDTELCIRVKKHNYELALNKNALVYHYPAYTFFNYVKKQYLCGISNGIFRSVQPDAVCKLSLFKTAILPLLAIMNFLKKIKKCYSEKLFTKKFFKEIILMYLWINAGYFAMYAGEISFIIKRRGLIIHQTINVIVRLLRNVKVKECLPDADIRRCNADLRRFSNGNLRESAFDLRKSALKNIPLLIRKSVIGGLIGYFMKVVKYYVKATLLPPRRSFILYLTNRCNERCRHCFYSRQVNKNAEEFSLDQIKNIAENYYKNTNTFKIFTRTISVGFTGGEPFLRDDLLEIIGIFKKAGITHFQINSNGLLKDKILDFSKRLLMQKIFFTIVLSIDGLEQTHDTIRNTSGAFQKTMSTLKALQNLGVPVGIITTINRLNYKEIPELVEFINVNFEIEPSLQLIRGVSQIKTPTEIKNTCDPLDTDIMISEDIIHEIREILYKMYLEKAVKDLFKIVDFARRVTYLNFHLDILKNGKKIFNCRAGKTVGVIYENGEVALCEMYKPIGNLKHINFDLNLIWNAPPAQKQRLFIRECICTHDCFINTEDNFKFLLHLIHNVIKIAEESLKSIK